MRVLKVSAKSGDGMSEFLDFLTARRNELRAATAV